MTPQEEAVILEAREILGRYLSQNPVLGSWQAVLDYCAVGVCSATIKVRGRIAALQASEDRSNGSMSSISTVRTASSPMSSFRPAPSITFQSIRAR